MMVDATRRGLLAAGMAGGAALTLTASRVIAQPLPGDEVIELWPSPPPGDLGKTISRHVEERSHDPANPDRWLTGIARPVLIVRRAPRPNGSAVLVVPGGGYGFLAYDNEGNEQAAWLNRQGSTAFILLYRLPAEGWAHRELVPLQDAQRAMRVIRRDAARYGVAPQRIAVLGFSAGGHLAGSLATRFDEPVYQPVDAADRLSARPDLAGLIYPVVSMAAPFTHGGSRDNLLGPDAPEAERRAASVEQRVSAQTPPCFIVQSSDDDVVPVANSMALFQALLAAKRPGELHIFDEGGHGFGVRLAPQRPASVWPHLFSAYAAAKGVFPPQAG